VVVLWSHKLSLRIRQRICVNFKQFSKFSLHTQRRAEEGGGDRFVMFNVHTVQPLIRIYRRKILKEARLHENTHSEERLWRTRDVVYDQ